MKKFYKKRIAFIYEGVQAEEELLTNMQSVFLSKFYEVETFRLPADGNIYMLWKRLVDDEFETNVIDLLKEMSQEAKKRMKEENLRASDFSEIYLFFDYDGHAASFSEKTVNEANEICMRLGMKEIKNKWDLLERMLLVFQNETEDGKLYISYPMIESIKEIDIVRKEYKRLYISLDKMKDYKHSFGEKSCYGNFRIITKEMWNIACYATIRQAGIIVNKKAEYSYEEFIQNITQLNLYHAQKQNYINAKEGGWIAILNSIPLFLLEYFDECFWQYITVEKNYHSPILTSN